MRSREGPATGGFSQQAEVARSTAFSDVTNVALRLCSGRSDVRSLASSVVGAVSNATAQAIATVGCSGLEEAARILATAIAQGARRHPKLWQSLWLAAWEQISPTCPFCMRSREGPATGGFSQQAEVARSTAFSDVTNVALRLCSGRSDVRSLASSVVGAVSNATAQAIATVGCSGLEEAARILATAIAQGLQSGFAAISNNCQQVVGDRDHVYAMYRPCACHAMGTPHRQNTVLYWFTISVFDCNEGSRLRAKAVSQPILTALTAVRDACRCPDNQYTQSSSAPVIASTAQSPSAPVIQTGTQVIQPVAAAASVIFFPPWNNWGYYRNNPVPTTLRLPHHDPGPCGSRNLSTASEGRWQQPSMTPGTSTPEPRAAGGYSTSLRLLTLNVQGHLTRGAGGQSTLD
ncbi:hypothetical protein HaLaN_19817 [Haematococcus lacustris]|uniref:Uncharacterized protein n=1 Tax=Haematococcus lacustris TaxID=44745 RepID=A0A699ZJ77_HAELA|nr:hypothetical protein HaLaN_19817 [Haematococcus lacustris]